MESQQAHNGQLKGGACSLCLVFLRAKLPVSAPGTDQQLGCCQASTWGRPGSREVCLPPAGRGQCACCHWVGSVQCHMQNKSRPGRPGTPVTACVTRTLEMTERDSKGKKSWLRVHKVHSSAAKENLERGFSKLAKIQP